MKRIIIITAATLALAASASAQQPQRPTDEEINARIQACQAQRNTAQDQVIILSGQAQAEVSRLNAEVEKLRKELAALKPKEDKKEPAKK